MALAMMRVQMANTATLQFSWLGMLTPLEFATHTNQPQHVPRKYGYRRAASTGIIAAGAGAPSGWLGHRRRVSGPSWITSGTMTR
jgi:hypothetical protein